MEQLSDKRLNELKDSIPKLIGDRIKMLRKDRNITRTELAELVGKDRQYFYKIEKGEGYFQYCYNNFSCYCIRNVSIKDFFDF